MLSACAISLSEKLRRFVQQGFGTDEFNVVEGHARAFYFPVVRYLRVFIPKVVHERNMADG